jgi:hypothetical protein
MRDGGWLQIVDPTVAGPPREYATITCVHCNRVVPLKSRKEDADWCRMCMKPICLRCAGKGCTPFERKLEAMEARARLFCN